MSRHIKRRVLCNNLRIHGIIILVGDWHGAIDKLLEDLRDSWEVEVLLVAGVERWIIKDVLGSGTVHLATDQFADQFIPQRFAKFVLLKEGLVQLRWNRVVVRFSEQPLQRCLEFGLEGNENFKFKDSYNIWFSIILKNNFLVDSKNLLHSQICMPLFFGNSHVSFSLLNYSEFKKKYFKCVS